MKDAYFSRPEVSNSDLSALKKYFYPEFRDYDPTEAYRFGTLVDAIITEPEKVDYFQRTVVGEEMPYSYEDFVKADEMKKAFRRDPLCNQLLPISEFQKVCIETVKLLYGNTPFSLPMRCKFDMWMPILGWGADIKSTTATSQKQFEEACRHFDYDRQRAVYMTLSGSNRDILIGISKVNFQVFKLPIERGDSFFSSGMEKFTDLAFKYWLLFEDFKIAA